MTFEYAPAPESTSIVDIAPSYGLYIGGEMGRTPRMQGAGGRDHWGRLTPLLMHGGGLTHGQVIGQSTRDGGEPAANPQRVANLVATVMNAVFNVGEVRLAPGLPTDVNRVITEVRPIPGLFS